MKDLFEGIEDLFVNVLFAPLDWIRELELESWFLANALNFFFVIIGFVAFLYWMKQLKGFNDNNEENRDPKAHSFLG
ncbi:uracil phosphoribosyltransferase [Salegentibacter sp. F188]|uniref:Uracil phosphoribosyltransferase n=1 Tax=Autumnicola patrickiae TaxID=3075591 RepID=A0ABU3E0W5_9FLAO|nr:uracil phosphoribosyltransferase [Salegentibacter sp. F188]MDT0689630.1 uracil phosphoribosyltransferase [Salegentibacter sp. F188]